MGGQLWLFKLLPFLLVQIIFFEDDDKFEAKTEVLFNVLDIILVFYEYLELIKMVLVGELLAAASFFGCNSHNYP